MTPEPQGPPWAQQAPGAEADTPAAGTGLAREHVVSGDTRCCTQEWQIQTEMGQNREGLGKC